MSKLFNKTKTSIFLFLIFFTALFLRIFDLGETPSGFHRDEVISSYAGRFIIENGKDFYGNPWPLLYVDKYGDYPPAIPMYFSGLTTYITGINVFSTRFPVALIGALSIFLIYTLAKEIWRDKRIALFSSFLVAILPWHLILSRATAEGIITLPFAIAGLLFLIKFVLKQKIIHLALSITFFFFTYFLYPSYRLLVPLLFLPIPIIFSLKAKHKISLVACAIFFITLTGLISSTDWGKGRFDQTSMFGAQNGWIIKEKASMLAQEEGHNRIKEVKTFHNKYVIYTKEFFRQYLSYFSPQYLFISGGLPYRYSVSDEGLLYAAMIPLLALSLIYLRQIKLRLGIYLLFLLFISPMPAPLTLDDVPNIHRTLFMIVPFTLLASFGFFAFFDDLKHSKFKKMIFIILFVFIFIELINFIHMYKNHYNSVKSSERGDTNKEVMMTIVKQKDNYNEIYAPVHDAFPIYYLFFSKNFDKSIIGKIHKNLKVDKINNITFFEIECFSSKITPSDLSKKLLIIDNADCKQNPNLTTIKQFSRHDGTNSYRLSIPNKLPLSY